jgi:hypothetical protein
MTIPRGWILIESKTDVNQFRNEGCSGPASLYFEEPGLKPNLGVNDHANEQRHRGILC